MKVVVVDFETFWSPTHSLSKMPAMAYCMHPETELISMAIKEGDDPTRVYFGEHAIRAVCNNTDWSDAMVVGHNMSAFDSMLLAWRLNVKPKAWGCTLAMSKPIHGLSVGGSLAKLVAHYQLGVKDNTALVNTKGKHLCDFTPEEREAMRVYNAADVDQCYALFYKLLPHFTKQELWLIDMTIRQLVEPVLALNKATLKNALDAERARKAGALDALASALGTTPDDIKTTLFSTPKFAKLLTSLGAEVPMKPSPTNPEMLVPALAKTDAEFVALTEHEDPLVADAAATRLGIKSTILETRLERLLEVGQMTKGKLPVPLNYCGAMVTGRFSGWDYNLQNLTRVDRTRPKLSDALRKSIFAPKGHKLVVADLSGIELRVNHFLWQVPRSMQLFTADPEKTDLYKDFATQLYNVILAEVSKQQRQVAKSAQLGLGFNAGAVTFRTYAKTVGGVLLTERESEDIVGLWREMHPEIEAGWRLCGRRLSDISAGNEVPVDNWGLVSTCKEGFKLPSGRLIRYPELRREDNEWCYAEGRYRAKIYGGKCVENIVQALARDIMMDGIREVFRLTKRRPVLTVHDEGVWVVPESEADAMLATVLKVLRTPPAWWPALAVWASGATGDCYGDIDK